MPEMDQNRLGPNRNAVEATCICRGPIADRSRHMQGQFLLWLLLCSLLVFKQFTLKLAAYHQRKVKPATIFNFSAKAVLDYAYAVAVIMGWNYGHRMACYR